jgi:hypothetical protein
MAIASVIVGAAVRRAEALVREASLLSAMPVLLPPSGRIGQRDKTVAVGAGS